MEGLVQRFGSSVPSRVLQEGAERVLQEGAEDVLQEGAERVLQEGAERVLQGREREQMRRERNRKR